MRSILHLSDLHFGRIDQPLLDPLVRAAAAAKPDLVVVSGDLTQRARRGQFRAARAFLAQLPMPQLVVPGNHDVPLYNVPARLAAPLAGYRRFIAEDTQPVFANGELVVVGLNSARSLSIAQGRLGRAQIRQMTREFERAPEGAAKILVSHHPFELPPGFESERAVRGAGRAIRAMADCGGDVVLSGHFHTGHAASSAVRYRGGRAVLLVQAGTATSTRRRGAASSFNVLKIDGPSICVEEHRWSGQDFGVATRVRFHEGPLGWMPARDQQTGPRD